MRPLIALLLALAVTAATAATAGALVARTPSATGLELESGRGKAVVKRQGTFFGHIRHGRIIATENVSLHGCEHKLKSSGRIECRGRGLTFWTPSFPARWRVVLRGRGISGSGVVHGCLVLDGADSGSTGLYEIGGADDPHPWPRQRTRYALGPAGC